jgi:hypothetical protein
LTDLMEKILLPAGFLAIIIISLLIDKRIAKHLSPLVGSYTYLFVAAVSLYYFFDAVVHSPNPIGNIYSYFWMTLFLLEVYLFLWKRRRKRLKSGQ